MLLQRIDHRLRIGARIEKARFFGAADNEEQMQAILSFYLKGIAPARSAGDFPADADMGPLANEEQAIGIMEQLPGQRKN